MSGNEIGEFRKNLIQAGARAFVSKNALARLALKELGHEKLAERLEGQTAFVWTDEDSVAVSKF